MFVCFGTGRRKAPRPPSGGPGEGTAAALPRTNEALAAPPDGGRATLDLPLLRYPLPVERGTCRRSTRAARRSKRTWNPACLRTRGPSLDTGVPSRGLSEWQPWGWRELRVHLRPHGPEGAGHATVRVPRGGPGAGATSRRLGRLLWETESPGPVAARGEPPRRGGGRTAGGPDGYWTDPREGAPTVFGPWVQCAFNLSMFSVSCNSHYDTQFAAVFIDPRAE